MRLLSVLAGVCFVVCGVATAEPLSLYVSTAGNDSWSGTLATPNDARTDGPFATLERARDAIRAAQKAGTLPTEGATVFLRGGDYYRDSSFALEAQDSAPDGAAIRYTAYSGERPRLLGGKAVGPFSPVTDTAILQRIQTAAQPNVVRADLSNLGINDYGDRTYHGRPTPNPGLEFFYGGARMTPARWPNEGYALMAAVPGGAFGTQIVMDRDFPRAWANPSEAYVWGYLSVEWADCCVRIASIDPAKRLIETATPETSRGVASGTRFYVCNVLEELDRPGEYFIDRAAHTLYFWPPANSASQEAYLGLTKQPLIDMKNVKNLVISGLAFAYTRDGAVEMEETPGDQILLTNHAGEFTGGGAVAMTDCSGCLLEGCDLVGIDGVGVFIAGGEKNTVQSCDMHDLGADGIVVWGGDRQTLKPSGHQIVNNHIWNFAQVRTTYTPGINVGGVGVRVAHNLLHHAPHSAILFRGNDHVFEFNEIHHVVLDTRDCGAIYCGRDWTTRGNRIANNFVHHLGINWDRHGVYLDDMFSSADVVGNVFWKASNAVFIAGGRDNSMLNNVVVDCAPAVLMDARCRTSDHCFDIVKARLKGIPYNKPPYSTRYPALASVLKDHPREPMGNRIERNICMGPAPWIDAPPYLVTDGILTLKDNFAEGDPGFMNAEGGDFRLRPDAPAAAIGFEPIPFERIGLYKDAARQTLPDPKAYGAYEDGPIVPPCRTDISEPPYPCSKARGPIRVDGKLDDWDALPIECKNPQQIRCNPDAWTGPEDCWFQIGAQYTDEYVYVAIRVFDDKVLTSAKLATWEQDGVEFRLDARPKEIRDTIAGLSENKQNILVILSPEQTLATMVSPDPAEVVEGVQSACASMEGGYGFEVAIPVAYIEKMQGAPWSGFRMNFNIDDTDKSKDRVAQLCWKPDWRFNLNFKGSGAFERRD